LKGFEYSRSGNPNRNALESTLASLESGGAHALAFSSGSATTATVLQSLGPNAHVISVNDVYGGTFRYIRRVAAENQGLEATFLDLENAGDDEILGAIRENTKVMFWVFGKPVARYLIIYIAHLDRITNESYVTCHRHPTHRQSRTFASI
jgi:cystathionine gamma-lyase